MNITVPFLIGLAGSLHCIGMCGPLATLAANAGRNGLWRRVLYNGGRVLTYGLLGVIISLMASVASLHGIQLWVSIIVGVAMILIGFTGMHIVPPRIIAKPLSSLASVLKIRFSTLMRMNSPFASVGMGMINGLLPCGMTWVALGYCVTLEWPVDAFVSMLMFGLGTVPAMIGFSTIISKISSRLHLSFRTIQTALLIVSGCLLIARSFANPESHQDHEIVTCGTSTSIQK